MDTYLGAVELFPYNYAPIGWLLCNGTTLQIMQNQALFAILGIAYGGNGQQTFGIPNLLGTEPIPGMKYYIATQGYFPPRQ